MTTTAVQVEGVTVSDTSEGKIRIHKLGYYLKLHDHTKEALSLIERILDQIRDNPTSRLIEGYFNTLDKLLCEQFVQYNQHRDEINQIAVYVQFSRNIVSIHNDLTVQMRSIQGILRTMDGNTRAYISDSTGVML